MQRLLLLALAAAFALPAAAQSIDVEVSRHDGLVVVDAHVEVAARAALVWSVLIDYDDMSRFLSAIKASRVVARDGNRLQVEQTAETKLGFMHFSASSLRAVELLPMQEIRSHLISGDFNSFDGTTRITEQGASTVIVNHSEYAPKSWLPPGLGTSVIQAQTRDQYAQMIQEIQRRQAAAESQPKTPKPASTGRL